MEKESVKSTLPGSDQMPMDSSTNPLLHSVFIRRLLKKCSFSVAELKSLRMTCSIWYHESLKLWREQACVKLYDVNAAEESDKLTHAQLLAHYNNPTVIYNFKAKPFFNFKLIGWTVSADNGDMVAFWLETSAHIRHLHIENCTFDKTAIYTKICLQTGPNVETLRLVENRCLQKPQRETWITKMFDAITKIKQSEEDAQGKKGEPRSLSHFNLEVDRFVKRLVISAREEETRLPLPWPHVLSYFPYVESLEIQAQKACTYDEGIRILYDIFHPSPVGRMFSKLKGLHIMDWCPHPIRFYEMPEDVLKACKDYDTVSFYLDLDWPLTSITFDLGWERFPIHLKALMERSAVSLRELKLFKDTLHYQDTIYYEPFPYKVEMRQVAVLHLIGDIVSSFRFLRFFPNLETLVIDRMGYRKRERLYDSLHVGGCVYHPVTHDLVERAELEADMIKFVMPKLEHLEVDFKFPERSLITLGKWMPKLKVLKTMLGNRTFGVVTCCWPRLQELAAVFGSDISDEGITGIIQSSSSSAPREGPGGIRRLQELRRFTSEALCAQGKLSDMSVREGFSKCRILTHLQICVSSKMSETAEDFMRDRLLSCKFIRNYGPVEGEHVGGCCQRAECERRLLEVMPLPKPAKRFSQKLKKKKNC